MSKSTDVSHPVRLSGPDGDERFLGPVPNRDPVPTLALDAGESEGRGGATVERGTL